MSQLTVNGNTYSDDGSTGNDMGNGGHRTHLLPMLGDAMVDMGDKVDAAAFQVILAAEQVSLAADQVGLAEAAAAAASATAGATLWVSGTTYAQGVCVWSPTDFKTYRRKIAGAGTTDPASDSTNWESLTGSAGIGSVSVISSAVSVALDASAAGYISVAMSAMGKSLTEVDATSLTVGGPRRIVKNDGGYPVGYRDNSGTLLASIAPGGVLYATLKDNSTAAGSWSVIGDNLEPGLITIDNTFSSTYAGTVLNPFVALDDSKSIHFLNNAAGSSLYAVCIDNSTGAVGTPVLVTSGTGSCLYAAKIDSTRALVVFPNSAVVISLSGATTLSVGTPVSISATAQQEDFSGAPKIAQLTSTLFVSTYTNAGNVYAVAISVSGTTVSVGTPTAVSGVVTGTTVASSTVCYRISDTTALLIWVGSTTSSIYKVANVVSVSGTTCTIGSAAQFLNGSSSGAPACCQLSATKYLVMGDNTSNAYLAHLSVSGTTVTVTHDEFLVETDTFSSGYGTFTGNGATRYNPHLFPLSSSSALLWYLDSSSVSRAVVISESGGTLTAGAKLYRSISSAAGSSAGGGAIFPQGVNEFMSVVSRLAATAGYSNILSTCKISGTAVTQGSSCDMAPIPPTAGANQLCGRLASGKYVLHGYASQGAGSVSVFSSNGDAIKYSGAIKAPSIVPLAANAPMHIVSGNRVVLLGANKLGTTAGVSTYQLRLLNVEIAQ